MGVKNIKILLIVMALLMLSACSSAELKSKSDIKMKSGGRIVVAGVLNEVEEEKFRDIRIGFGAKNLLVQLIFDSGKFMLVEEKTKLEEIIKKSYGGDKANIDKNLMKIISGIEADFTCYGNIYYIGMPRETTSIAGIKSTKKSTEIRVEVTIIDNKTGNVIKEIGKGMTTTKASSMLLEYNEKNADIENTRIGIALREALKDAYSKLLKRIN